MAIYGARNSHFLAIYGPKNCRLLEIYGSISFLGSAQPASIYRNVCVSGLDKIFRGCVDNTEANDI